MNETEFKTQLSSIQTVFIGMGDYYGKEFLDAVRTLMKLSEMTSKLIIRTELIQPYMK